MRLAADNPLNIHALHQPRDRAAGDVELLAFFQMVGHEGLAFRDPDVAQLGHIRALLFKRLKVLFFVTNQVGAATDPPMNDSP